MATSSETAECCCTSLLFPTWLWGSGLAGPQEHIGSGRSLSLSVWPCHRACFHLREAGLQCLETRPLVTSAGLGFRMDAQEGAGSYFSTVTEKGPFQYLCPAERSSGISWGVARQGRGVSQGPIRKQSNSEVKRFIGGTACRGAGSAKGTGTGCDVPGNNSGNHCHPEC